MTSFTYDGDPSASTLAEVRFLLSDTDSANALMSDEEITHLISQWTTARATARAAAEILAGKYARQAETTKQVQDIRLTRKYSAIAQQFRELADQLRSQATRLDAGGVRSHITHPQTVTPYDDGPTFDTEMFRNT